MTVYQNYSIFFNTYQVMNSNFYCLYVKTIEEWLLNFDA